MLVVGPRVGQVVRYMTSVRLPAIIGSSAAIADGPYGGFEAATRAPRRREEVEGRWRPQTTAGHAAAVQLHCRRRAPKVDT